VRRADHLSCSGKLARRLQRLRDPEVGEHRAAGVVDHDVGRLDVAVHDPAGVGMPQGTGRFPQNPLRVLHRHLPRLEDLVQRPPRDVLHHEEVQIADALDGVDGNDVGMVELGGGACLVLEALHELLVV
jgi:hypothetical protein